MLFRRSLYPKSEYDDCTGLLVTFLLRSTSALSPQPLPIRREKLLAFNQLSISDGFSVFSDLRLGGRSAAALHRRRSQREKRSSGRRRQTERVRLLQAGAAMAWHLVSTLSPLLPYQWLLQQVIFSLHYLTFFF